MIFNDQVHNQYISFSFTSPSSILVTSQADKITSNKIESGLHQVYPLKTLHVKKKTLTSVANKSLICNIFH